MNIVDPQFNGPVSQDVICFGPFRLSVTERILESGGVRVQLGSRALDILIALVECPAQVVSKKELCPIHRGIRYPRFKGRETSFG
jgi:DNA-binding response OmpR family regulator